MTGRREATKARTRAAIIEAGIRLMHEQGYDATSTTAIARAACVSPATLFNYFPTKNSIIFADDHLWALRLGPVTAMSTPRQTLRALVLDRLVQPGWTLPADDPVTRMRFELVRGEPALVAAQTTHAFSQVPALARAVQSAHPELSDDEALAHAGATVGAVLAALTWAQDGNLRTAIEAALDRTQGT